MSIDVIYDLDTGFDLVIEPYSRRQVEIDLDTYPLKPGFPFLPYIELIQKKRWSEILEMNSHLTLDQLFAYPGYPLLFLLSRGYPYPKLTPDQQQLSQIRQHGNESTRKIIDRVWALPVTPDILWLLQQNERDPRAVQNYLDTPFDYWYRYAEEYFPLVGNRNLPFVDMTLPNDQKILQMIQWTDNHIFEVAKGYGLNLPRLSDFVTRLAWVEHAGNILRQKIVVGRIGGDARE